MLNSKKVSGTILILKSILLILPLIVALFFAGMLSQFYPAYSELFKLGAFLAVALGLSFYIHRSKNWTSFGFKPGKSTKTKSTIYIPLFILSLYPLLNGINFEIGFKELVYIILFMAVVAFVEEVIYRGIMLHILKIKGSRFAIVGSAVLFGVTHLINALDGKSLYETLLQVLFALVVGLILATIALYTKNILVCIVYHFINNVLASVSTVHAENNFVLMILIALQVLYLIYLYMKVVKNSQSAQVSV